MASLTKQRYDINAVAKDVKVLQQHNINIPDGQGQKKARDLFIKQMTVITQIIGLYCQGEYDEKNYTEAREFYLMNSIGLSPQLFSQAANQKKNTS